MWICNLKSMILQDNTGYYLLVEALRGAFKQAYDSGHISGETYEDTLKKILNMVR